MLTSDRISALYQDCDLFYAEKTQRTLSQQLELLQQICQHSLQLARKKPMLLLSQLSLTPGSGSISGKLYLKQAALVTAVALAGRWPDEIILPLLKGCLLQPLAVTALLEKSARAEQLSAAEQQQLKFPALVLIKQQKELAEQAGALNLLRQCYAKQKGLMPWQSAYFSQLLSFCWQVVRLMLPGAGKLIALEKITTALLPQATTTELQFLQALACLNSASYSTGRFVRDAQANLALVLCEIPTTTQMQLLLQPYDKANKQLLAAVIQAATDLQLLTPRLYQQEQWLEGWSQQHELLLKWPAAEDLPALSWLQQLTLAAKVSQQTELIEQHPWLKQQLQQKASAQSRQHQTIHSTQHAIALLGQDQLLPLLKQAWLEQHCQQQRQPQHNWLLEFRRVLAKSLYLLTQPVRFYALTMPQAELLAWCLSWPLWQQSELRLLALSHPAEPVSLLSQWLTQQLWQSEHYQQLAVKTLKHLQFSQSWQDACLHYRALPTSSNSYAMAFVLAFAFDLTTSVLSATMHKDSLEHSYKFARPYLEDSPHSASDWQLLLIEQTQPVTHLLPSCSFISPFPEIMPQDLPNLSQMSA